MYQGGLARLLFGVNTMSNMSEMTPTEGDPPERAETRWAGAARSFEAWRGGDPHAMDELVRLMSPVLWHVVRAYGLDRALAEDVVQTTWMTLVQRQASIVEPQALAGWLTTCARREAWRVGRVQRRADPTETERLEPNMPVTDSAEQTAVVTDAASTLWTAVRVLDQRCQRLLRVVAFDDRPDYAVLAKDLGMPVGSIGPTRQRCLAKLRSLLVGRGWAGSEVTS